MLRVGVRKTSKPVRNPVAPSPGRGGVLLSGERSSRLKAIRRLVELGLKAKGK